MATLRRLQGIIRTKHLKQIADGLVMSHVRYALPVYLTSQARLTPNDPVHQGAKAIQTKMNEMMRTILDLKIRDKISIQTKLKRCKMLSVNQMLCKAILVEMWKAVHFSIRPISSAFQERENKRYSELFKTTNDPNSFISIGAKLWEQTTEKFRKTNLLKVANKEAQILASTLPI